MKPLSQCRLYAFVDTGYLNGRSALSIAHELCVGGADLIQLRAKNFPPAEIRKLAEAILPITREAGVGLVINDSAEIAQEIGADCCHLGQEDFFDAGRRHVAEVKAGRALGIGLSTHAPTQAERALAAGADYIAIGPVFATATKPNMPPVTLDYVRWAATHVRIPWFAIGGIHLGNVHEVLRAGAERICVVSAILDAPDIAGACRDFKNALESR